MIDVWGADHAGYIKRMQAAVAALSDRRAGLDVKVVQLVKLLGPASHQNVEAGRKSFTLAKWLMRSAAIPCAS